MFENWKQIEGFANYEVSDHGRIRNKTNDKMVKAYEGAGGRMSVTLHDDNKKYGRRLHILVANALSQTPTRKNTCIMQTAISGIAEQITCFGFPHWSAISCLSNKWKER